MLEKTCISCKKKTVNDKGTVTFSCPQCGNYDIVRCTNCRSNASRYACPGCGFKGPN
ncbi:MAG TPA: zinc finger domain-containing protein [Candidatus Nanoarchaeia archaeon]|nr:zinc finger domain-containing protein [Candidatus Nanoarchaeia archaeon]